MRKTMNTTPILERRPIIGNVGVVALMRVDGKDETPALVARTSYRNQSAINPKTGANYTNTENAGLTRYLLEHGHSTPIEFCGAVFYMEMPIFVARQLVRHRTASINEESLRYVEARNEFYIPDTHRFTTQSTSNKQGSSDLLIDNPEETRNLLKASMVNSFKAYTTALKEGVNKETARIVLPLATMTAWYWKCDLHNILHLLSLRMDKHAQWETRQYAKAMYELLKPAFPTIMEKWSENHL